MLKITRPTVVYQGMDSTLTPTVAEGMETSKKGWLEGLCIINDEIEGRRNGLGPANRL